MRLCDGLLRLEMDIMDKSDKPLEQAASFGNPLGRGSYVPPHPSVSSGNGQHADGSQDFAEPSIVFPSDK